MDPNDAAGKPEGKTVMDVLLSKHPDQEVPDKEAFIECEELPVFLDVDVTASHVERVAHKLSGGAGPSGFNSGQLQDLLLKHGNHSAELREAFAAVTRTSCFEGKVINCFEHVQTSRSSTNWCW